MLQRSKCSPWEWYHKKEIYLIKIGYIGSKHDCGVCQMSVWREKYESVRVLEVFSLIGLKRWNRKYVAL